MTIRYVSGTGSDSNTGLSTGQAFRNIQTAASLMVAGDTTYVMNGTYTSTNTSSSQGAIVYLQNVQGTVNAPITIMNYSGHTPVIQGGANDWQAIQLFGCSYVIIDGITCVGNSQSYTLSSVQALQATGSNTGASTNGSGIAAQQYISGSTVINSHHITVRNCSVSYFAGGGIGFSYCDYVTATNNKIFGNCNWTCYGAQGLSILQPFNYDSNQSTYRMIVQGNISYNNVSYIPWIGSGYISEGHGLMIDTGYYDSALTIPYTGKILFAENISYGNGGAGIQLFEYPCTAANPCDVVNNTCYMNGSTNGAPEILPNFMGYTRLYNNIMYARSGGNCSPTNYGALNSTNITFQHCLAFNGAFNPSDQANPIGLVNITGQDPLFVSASTGNFSLSSGSPAIDNGDPTFNAYLNVTPYNGSGATGAAQIDIGALEYSGTPTAVPNLIFLNPTVGQSRGTSGTTPYNFTISRLGATTSAVTVNYAVTASGNLPAAATDFSGNAFPTGTVTIPAGSSSVTLPITINGTSAVVTDLTFTLTISAPTSGLIAEASVTGTILSSSCPVITNSSVNYFSRGTSGTTNYVFVVTRSGILNQAVSIPYITFGTNYGYDPAQASDFASGAFASGTLNFAAGVTSQTVTIPVLGTTAIINNREFQFYLNNVPSNVAVNNNSAFGYLLSSTNTATSISLAANNPVQTVSPTAVTPYTFTATLGAPSANNTAVTTCTWSAVGTLQNNVNSSDFVGGTYPTGTVTFPIGSTSQTITVNVAANALPGGTKNFQVVLSNPSAGATINVPYQVVATINNANVAPSLAITATNATQASSPTAIVPFTFTITRSASITGSTTVNYSVAGYGSNPALATDFSGGVYPSGTVSFTSGVATQVVTINVAAQTLIELTKTFQVTISGASGGATISNATAVGTINSGGTVGPVLSIAAANATQASSATATVPFTFTVTRTANLDLPCSATYTVTGSGSTAAVGTDFVGGVLPSGTVTFAAQVATQTITVNAAANTFIEPTKTFTVTLSTPSTGASIGTATATGTILSGGTIGPALAIAATNATQAVSPTATVNFTFTVTRSQALDVTASVVYAVTGSGSNPAQASDFVGTSFPTGVLSFSGGQTTQVITIPVAANSSPAPTKTFTVTLSGVSTGATITTATATGTINNVNASASLAIAATNANLAVGTTGSTTNYTFTVTRTNNTNVISTVNYAVTGSGANPAIATTFSGAVFPTGTLTFSVGVTTQIITIPVAGTSAPGPTLGFTVTLSNPSSGTTIGIASDVGSILNNNVAAPSTISISPANASQYVSATGQTAYTFTVTRTGNTSSAGQATYNVVNINPAVPSDFVGGVFPSGTVNFNAGDTSETITILVAGTTNIAPTKNFEVVLSNPPASTSIAQANAFGTILNSNTTTAPASLSISPLSASNLQQYSSPTPFTFSIAKTVNPSVATSVSYTVTGFGSNPALPTDFVGGTFPSGTVNFATSDLTQTLTLNVVGLTSSSTTLGANKQFLVNIANPTSGAVVQTNSAIGTILAPITVGIAPVYATRMRGVSGITPYIFEIIRNGNTTTESTVSYIVSGSGTNPAQPTDFSGGVYPSGTVIFAPGQNNKIVDIGVVGIATTTDVTFTITLLSPTLAIVTGASASGTIQNNG